MKTIFWNVKDNYRYFNYVYTLMNYHDAKNTAYGLQYLEFIHYTLQESCHSVVLTHQCKTFVVMAASIIELICIDVLKQKGYYRKGMKGYTIIQTSIDKKIFDDNIPNLYDRLHELREMRNKVHLHIGERTNHDFNSFGLNQMKIAKRALGKVLVSKYFHPDQTQPEILFDFLILTQADLKSIEG